MRRGSLTCGVAVALATGLAWAAAPVATATDTHHPGCRLPSFGPGATYHPRIDPRTFSPDVTNTYFPLRPGRISIYTGVKNGARALDVVVPTSRIRVVDGVRTRVVEDRLYQNNVLEERTSDYYAQDRCGNVWYFGEDTATLDAHGKVTSTEGSFHAGVDGAQPGVYMQAHPQLGRAFRQEWYEGQAEDVFSATARNARVTVPYGSFRHALRTKETTALEPGIVDEKFYVRGIGEVIEEQVAGGGQPEVLRLVEIIEAS